MLKKIPKAKDPNIIRLNALIDEYNSCTNPATSAIILQQIKKLSDDLFVHFHEIFNPKQPDREHINYLDWYAINGIAQELLHFGKPANSGKPSEKSFVELSTTDKELPDKNAWVYATSPTLSFLYSRQAVYSKIDPLLENANKKKGQVKATDKETLKSYYQALKELQNGILDILNSDIPTEAVPYYRDLLASTNKEIKKVSENLPELAKMYKQEEQVASALLGDVLYSGDPEEIMKLAEKLNSVDGFTRGDFTLKRLGLGGNNKNWVATNDATGQQFLVRFMSGDDFKPSVVSQLYSNPQIAPFLTHDYVVAPLGQLENDSSTLLGNYVTTVSEFCPNGDLNSYLKTQTSKGLRPEQRADRVANFGFQAAKIVNVLYTQGFAHPDIKAENFLLGSQGEVLLSDIKFIRPMAKGNQLAKNDGFNTTYTYASREYGDSKASTLIDMNSFSSYQLGLMLYDLATGKENEGKFDWIDKLRRAKRDQEPWEVLSFEDPIFQTNKGKEIHALIIRCLDKDPQKRPALAEVTRQLQILDTAPSQTHKEIQTQQADLSQKRHEILGYKSAVEEVRGKEESPERVCKFN